MMIIIKIAGQDSIQMTLVQYDDMVRTITPDAAHHPFHKRALPGTSWRSEHLSDAYTSRNQRKTFASRLLSRGAGITDVQHLLGHASVEATEKAYAAFVKNERFKQTIDLSDKPMRPKLMVVR